MTAPATQIRAVADRYAALLTAHDADGIADLYADDATIEDPAGSTPVVGRREILAFYLAAIDRARPERVDVTGPVRIVDGCAAAAVPLRSHGTRDGAKVVVDIIDVFTFDEHGRITSMRAYWGSENVNPG